MGGPQHVDYLQPPLVKYACKFAQIYVCDVLAFHF